ncbi:MAG: hypothetical protein AAGK32_20460, partial [Actinomycetota bacterium]
MVRDAFFPSLAPTDEQTQAVEDALRRLELDRTERIRQEPGDDEADAPQTIGERPATMVAGVPLTARRTGGPRWIRSLFGRNGDDPGSRTQASVADA